MLDEAEITSKLPHSSPEDLLNYLIDSIHIGPQDPAKVALELLERLYKKQFWTDEERKERLIVDIGDTSGGGRRMEIFLGFI